MKSHPDPITEPALPLLLVLVCFAISLVVLITNKFIHPFDGELLSPVIISAVAILLPTYLAVMLSSSEKCPREKLSDLSIRLPRADCIFFLFFSTLFMISLSALSTVLIGAEDAAAGMTLFGTFTAGVNEYTVSYPYLIFVYALLPAIAEELLFRGVLISLLSKLNFTYSALLSVFLFALFSFSVGGFVTSVFTGIMMVFILYTTGSLIACATVHFIYNIYRLFLESNLASYYLSGSNRLILFIILMIALLASALLFLTESLRLYRPISKKIKEGKGKSAERFKGAKTILDLLLGTFAYIPNLIFFLLTVAIFFASVIINFVA